MSVLVVLQYVQWGGSVSVEEEVKEGERQLVTVVRCPSCTSRLASQQTTQVGWGSWLHITDRQTQDPDSITVSAFTNSESETRRLV